VENYTGRERPLRRKILDAIPASNDGETWVMNPIGTFHHGLPHNETHDEVERAADGALLRATQSHRPRLSTRSSPSMGTRLEEGTRDERWVGLPLW
jgi:hypothetical protein